MILLLLGILIGIYIGTIYDFNCTRQRFDNWVLFRTGIHTKEI